MTSVVLTGGTWVVRGGVLRWQPHPKPPKGGRKPKPLTMSPEDVRRGYSQYRQGFRTEFTIQANREYQRAWRRNRRMAHLAKQEDSRPV